MPDNISGVAHLRSVTFLFLWQMPGDEQLKEELV